VQRKLQYFPDTAYLSPQGAGLPDFEEVKITTDDGETIISWFKPADEGYPTVLYFTGNAGNLSGRAERFHDLADGGYGVLGVSYRGYGGSSGSPTENGLIEDGKAAQVFLESKNISPQQTIYFGESLGSGVAVALAASKPPLALVLDSPFTSAADVAQKRYWFIPASLLTLDKYDSLSRISGVQVPLLVFHGVLDSVIPIEFGKRLFDASPSSLKKFLEYENQGHITLTMGDMLPELSRFLESSGIWKFLHVEAAPEDLNEQTSEE